ncbi:two-component sensor histidine kinase [Bacillus sp. FJAT-42376]|uniref:ATP-binding protein n=1 Tax=Bacillus sp. FJAT-42376 TaxID=2014076 RepID=UPI000F4EAA11|nr:ATP-binding protein [Bacillus sp. FJAT-42376]AZB41615.1 two-component sensor histidine kinase [Bacillus sp. FJAT-42376]
MIVEKLLLHVLIVLAPILVHSLFISHRPIPIGRPSYLIGAVYGITATICMVFAYKIFGLYWDLRYVPLLLAVLYGGVRGGMTALGIILVTRFFLGGDAIIYGMTAVLLSAFSIFLIAARFRRSETKGKKTGWVFFAAVWPVLFQFSVLSLYLHFHTDNPVLQRKMIYVLAAFGLIQIAASVFAALLHEASLERSRLQEEVFRSEKLNTLGEMAASIAHEVRNPLTVVKGFLQLMQADHPKTQFPYIPLVLSELERAESIISEYLNFAKPQLEKLEQFELGGFLEDVVQLLNPLATKDGVHLTCQTEAEILLETDRNQLCQAMINLIKNAIEATPEGGNVHVSMIAFGREAEIKIADTGSGMTKEQLAKIGSLYYTTKEKGTGLGTMVSLGIIDAMGGKTVYSSLPGKGTEVRISLKAKGYLE